MLAASEPHSGSVMAKAAIASPAATRGSQSRFCSIVPNSEIAPEPSPCMAKAKSASPRVIGEGLAGDREAAHVGPVLAVGDAQLEESGGAELAHQGAAFAVEIVGVAAGRDCRAHQCFELARKLAVARPRRTARRGSWRRASVALEHRLLLGRERLVGALEVVGLHALAPGPRASMSSAVSMRHVPIRRRAGAWSPHGRTSGRSRARARAPALRRARRRRAGCRSPRRGLPRRSSSRPVNSSSAARPWPMIRGRIAQAPMSAPLKADAGEQEGGLRIRALQAEVAGHGEDRPGAGADAFDRGDDRLRAGAHRAHQVAGHARELEQARRRPSWSAGR